MPKNHLPIVLIILDGWGCTVKSEFNAIQAANTPFWHHLWLEYPHTLIQGSGSEVGLPASQMGNSEVGHLNLGAGRVVYQEITRVSRSIQTGSFFTNNTLTDAVDLAKDNNKAIHILGLLSPGGVHSHENHIFSMVKLAAERGATNIYLHAFLDGRDTPPKSAYDSIAKMEDKFHTLGQGRFASVIGRYYAMDRDHRWPRIQKAYDLITLGKASYVADSALTALQMAYDRGETDEFVEPTAINTPVKVCDGDVLLFMNYRSDRARQITRPFIEPDFNEFHRESVPKIGTFTSLTEYSSEFNNRVAFPSERLKNVFGEHISNLGFTQLRIAETEKYAHVTFFFNGGREQPFGGETRILVPSPHVATYDLKPEMSAYEITDNLVEAINSSQYDVIICNYANPDMVGHTGDFQATVKAIEVVDNCLEKVITAVQKAGGEAIITADHGNAEQMMGENTGQPHTAHTSNEIPFIYVGRPVKQVSNGALCDVAPTILYLMEIEPPVQMSGHPLLELAT